ncbi:MARVEL domain-containing protein [Caenorhabditis elegans]|uniref:MARVEL domain-containing protein n=1 Tax=Caenorhabditis elegans TaxID=6239 RepID=Q20731_CAEEL|nr:MARVEL domain-containing protein [Caenorhabditis elegans]CAB01215.2 MARVEL domain-containing protein [Caenorhabditis elegans]|eukprot:NP_001122950.1 Uncharacterized protein CELE_F53F4.6 [Caenorhabditis elegans]
MSDQANRVVYVEQRRHIVVNSPPQSPTPLHHFPVNQYSSASSSHHPPTINQSQQQIYQRNTTRRRKMFSQRAFNGIVFCIRIFILILAIVSMILVLTAPGACFSRYLNGQSISREICPGQNSIFPMNADRWSNALHFQGRGQNVYGQVALICITLAFGLITVGVSCVTLATGSILTYPQILISGLSMVAFIVTGGVETWYATGYDHMEFFIQAVGNGVFSGCAGIPGCQIQFVVKGWAVAAAFYFLGALLYVVDMSLIFISRENEPAPPVVFRGNRTIRSSF